jgi:hypothetical protein
LGKKSKYGGQKGGVHPFKLGAYFPERVVDLEHGNDLFLRRGACILENRRGMQLVVVRFVPDMRDAENVSSEVVYRVLEVCCVD